MKDSVILALADKWDRESDCPEIVTEADEIVDKPVRAMKYQCAVQLRQLVKLLGDAE